MGTVRQSTRGEGIKENIWDQCQIACGVILNPLRFPSNCVKGPQTISLDRCSKELRGHKSRERKIGEKGKEIPYRALSFG